MTLCNNSSDCVSKTRILAEPIDVQTQENISVKQLNANSTNSSIQCPTKPQKSSTLSSQEMLQQMSESKHAPGIRKAGCPCCEPDSAATYADSMML